MKEGIETSTLIDDKNFELWNTLKQVQNIEVNQEIRSDYLVSSENSESIIYVPVDNLDSASFTHELLHIDLRVKKILLGSCLTLIVRESPRLQRIISEKLLDHLGNCLDHIKMLPAFIQLGYDESQFISDYSINKLPNSQLNEIKKYFVSNGANKKYFSLAVDLFIGKFFAVKACPNKSFKYDEQLDKLRKIDRKLFQILDNFYSKWVNFDYLDTDPISGNYHFLAIDFIDELETWMKGKTFI